MAKVKFKIEGDKAYNIAMKRIDQLLSKGEEMSEEDATKLKEMETAA